MNKNASRLTSSTRRGIIFKGKYHIFLISSSLIKNKLIKFIPVTLNNTLLKREILQAILTEKK